MDPIFSQPAPTAPPSLPALFPASTLPVSTAPVKPAPAMWQRDRIDRIAALSQEDTAAGLLWLAMNFPAVCDAMLDKAEFDAIDDEYPGDEPDPFCAECGAAIGIFLRYGTDWRHYRGDGAAIGQIELLDPGHEPVVAWHLPRTPATR
jgi:hypothetical protein